MKFLIVVDMPKDFINGALGTQEAVAIVPNVVEKIKGFDGKVITTMDTLAPRRGVCSPCLIVSS